MTPETAAALARIRRIPDPPQAPVRLCAWSQCKEPLVRRTGELAHDFTRRVCCNHAHGRRRGAELFRGTAHRFGPRCGA